MPDSEYSREQIRRYFRDHFPGERIDLVDEVVVECPFHDSVDQPHSLSLFLDSGLWYCSKSECGAAGNLLDFEEKMRGFADEEQAWDRIRSSMGLPPPLPNPKLRKNKRKTDSASKTIEQIPNRAARRRQRTLLDVDSYLYELKKRDQDLYHLPEVLRADKVFIVALPKDADRLISAFDKHFRREERAKAAVTANSGRDGGWHWKHGRFFTNKSVFVLVADNSSAAGVAEETLSSVYGYARRVRLVRLAGLERSDGISEWLLEHELRELVEQAKRTQPLRAPDDESE